MLESLISSFDTAPQGGTPQGDTGVIHDCIRAYASAEIFAEMDALSIADNPFRRPLINRHFGALELGQPLELTELHSNASLIANRLLLSIYERDFVFLPSADIAAKQGDLEVFYSERLRVLGEIIRPHLERYLFQRVEQEVSVSGPWTMDAFASYFEDYRERFAASDNLALMETITSARDPVAAAKMYLIQLAGDFLLESSAMTRNVMGNFGPLQSALFKIVIDEYGYGVHETKHSTLFQKVLKSCGLNNGAHAYWQLYLPSSLFLNNYYNYLSKNHTRLFRYIGGLLQIETAFRVTCKQMAAMMKSVFGASAEVDYFTEHVHIDTHHSRMVMETLVVPAVQRYGDSVLMDIIRGFEESQVIGQVFSAGLSEHMTWADSFAKHNSRQPAEASGASVPQAMRVSAGDDRWTGTYILEVDTVYNVDSGQMDIVTGYKNPLRLGAGESALVPRGRLHALAPESGCTYTMQSIA
jgi:hypothetical protein